MWNFIKHHKTLNAMWYPGVDHKTEKRHYWKMIEISIKSGVKKILMYHCWFFSLKSAPWECKL